MKTPRKPINTSQEQGETIELNAKRLAEERGINGISQADYVMEAVTFFELYRHEGNHGMGSGSYGGVVGADILQPASKTAAARLQP